MYVPVRVCNDSNCYSQYDINDVKINLVNELSLEGGQGCGGIVTDVGRAFHNEIAR